MSVKVNGTQNNCSAYLVGEEVICTADEGYEFTTNVNIFSADEYGNMDEQTYNPTSNPTYFTENNTVFTIEVSEISYPSYEVNCTATLIETTVYHNVTFKDWDGTVLKEESVKEGTGATPPTDPTRVGYTFTGWDVAYNNVVSDLVVTALYEIKSFKVTFKDYDGTVLKVEDVEYGGTATPPTDPVREGYEFSGWDKPTTNIKVDTIITATYGLTIHTIIFKNDSEVVETRSVGYGLELGSFPTDPTKDGYRFLGWFIGDTQIYETYIVVEDVTINAKFERYTDVAGELVNASAIQYDWGIEVTADEGYDFKSSLELIIVDNVGDIKYNYFSPTDDTSQVFNEDRTVATIPNDKLDLPSQNVWSVEVNGIATLIDGEEEFITSFISIYKVDRDLLNEVAGFRWGSDTDYGSFIIKLYQLPVFISDSLISSEKVNVKFGSFESDVRTNYLTVNVLEVDLGTIIVDPIYNNVFDYRDTSCILHIPYADPIKLDVNYVMGAEIRVSMAVDLYTGYTTLNVISSKVDGVLIRQKVNFTREIPYVKSDLHFATDRSTGNYNVMGSTKTYIEIQRGKPIYNDDVVEFGKPCNVIDRIGNHTGYLEVSKVLLNTTATNVEQNELKRILASGIYIE